MFLWPNEISGHLSVLQSDPTDDFVDRINYIYTVSLLIFFATLVGTKQHFGSPIQCMPPAHFPGTWTSYAHDYCFVSNTYSLNVTAPITNGPTGTITKQEIVYYQWVPYVLVIQAFLLLIPKILWNCMTSFHGLDMRSVVEETTKLRSMRASSERTAQLMKIASFAVECLHYARTSSFLKLLFGSWFFTVSYILTKWAFVAVALAEVALITLFIGDGSLLWGYHLLNKIAVGHTWRTTGLFPRVTFCDFNIAHLAQTNTYSVQCVLMINILNEKIFLFLWFWITTLAIMDLASALYTTLALTVPSFRRNAVLNLLQVETTEWQSGNEGLVFSRFIRHTLKPDGTLLLRFVNNHAGGMIANELAWQMWGIVKTIERLPNSLAEQGWTQEEKRSIIPCFGAATFNLRTLKKLGSIRRGIHAKNEKLEFLRKRDLVEDWKPCSKQPMDEYDWSRCTRRPPRTDSRIPAHRRMACDPKVSSDSADVLYPRRELDIR